MNHTQLNDWFDRHHVHVVRTEGTLPDGVHISRFVHRNRFFDTLPLGTRIEASVLAMDLTGSPYDAGPRGNRLPIPGELYLKPDLATLITDGTDPDLGHCIVDLASAESGESAICPRSLLRRSVGRLERMGYTASVAFAPEFVLFRETFLQARDKGYRNLAPLALSPSHRGHMSRNAYPAQAFMHEVTKRMEWRGIEWAAWEVGSAAGKIRLSLEPCAPVAAADRTIRAKQALFEVAVDMGLSITFMARPVAGTECAMQMSHSLAQAGKPAFYDETRPGYRAQILVNWLGGLSATMAGALSLHHPSVNSWKGISRSGTASASADPGELSQLPGIRSISSSPRGAMIEQYGGSADLNPYLALAVTLAGGIAGLMHQLAPPGPSHPGPRLPASIQAAAAALGDDALLAESLGQEFIDYWIRSRSWESQTFHANEDTEAAAEVTDWELQRYFELA